MYWFSEIGFYNNSLFEQYQHIDFLSITSQTRGLLDGVILHLEQDKTQYSTKMTLFQLTGLNQLRIKYQR